MKLGHLFQTLEIALRSRWRLVVLAFITLLFCIFVFPKIARPAVTPESLPGLSLEQWRSQSPISRSPQDSPSPEELLQKAHELQLEGYYRNACKLLLKALDVNLSDTEFERLIRDEYPEADVEQEVHKLFPVEPETPLRAKILRSLGDVLRTIGAIRPSEIVLKQSLKIGERFADSEETSAIHFSLGNTYRALGKREQIIQETEEQKKQQKAINDRQALDHYDRASAQSSNASLKLRAKLSKLSLLVEIKPDRDVISLANDVKSTLESLELEPKIETVYARLDLAQSLTCLKVKNSRTEFEYPQPPIVNLCQSDSAEVLPAIEEEDMPKWDEIEQLMVTAEQQAEQLGDGRSQSYALGNLGEVYEIQEQFNEAKAVTEKAATRATQSNQLSDILYRWEWQLGRLAWKVKGDRKDILAAYSSTFNSLENLQQNLGSLNADIQFNFRDEVEPAYRQFVDVLLQNAPGMTEPSQYNLKQAREVIEALQIAELNNFFREACLKPNTKETERSDPNAAIIYPIILNERISVIFSQLNKPLKFHTFDESQDQIEEIKKILISLRKQIRDVTIDTTSLKTQLNQVYNCILKPFELDLEISKTRDTSNVKTLVFISEGLFRNIPMSALYTGEQYLIERYAIAVAPSLKLLDSEGLPFLETIKTLVAGASDAPSFTAEGRGFLKILNVKREIDQIENELPNHQKIVEADFTKLNFQNKLKSNQFSIIHLATHGKFSSNPENTFILAWDDKINIRELKSFFTQNVKISRPIELLVLSACQTAKGDNRAALGLAGVAVQAGTRSTLASLWHVDDFSTARLMTEFYTTLKQLRATKAEALRQAQLSLLKNPEDDLHMRPYYWAPFTIIGNWL